MPELVEVLEGAPQVVEVHWPSSPALVEVDPSGAHVIIEVDVPGQQGPAGPQGPAGASGGAVTVARDLVAVGSVSVEHAFAYRPQVRVIDTVAAPPAEVHIGAEYLDDTHVFIQFPSPFTGQVVLQ